MQLAVSNLRPKRAGTDAVTGITQSLQDEIIVVLLGGRTVCDRRSRAGFPKKCGMQRQMLGKFKSHALVVVQKHERLCMR